MKPVAVVTGGSGGIGSAVRQELGRRGFETWSLSPSGGVDAADEAQVEAFFARLPRLDALVHAAAVLIPAPFAEVTAEQWDRTLEAGLRSAFLTTRSAFRMMPGRGGSIVMVSSLAGVAGAEKFPGTAAYVAAKSAMAGLTEALAVEGRPLGIRVNAVSPGAVRTRMLDLSPAPSEPALEPSAVAGVVAWLASPDSSPLSGANLRMDP
ncbi:MAG: SDR family NAD(P)-dependent oxidoreductase [Candidatus Dormibacteraceae bacterium]